MRSLARLERLRGAASHMGVRSTSRVGSVLRLQLVAMVTVLFGALALVVCTVSGCGDQYRPVVTPVTPTGPAAQPGAYLTIISQPGNFGPASAGLTAPCSGGPYPDPSIYTLLDFAGDSVVAQANGGNGPLTFSLDSTGVRIFAPNCDGTLTAAEAATNTLITNKIQSSTLLPGSEPTNAMLAGGSLYVTEAGLHGSALPGQAAPCLVTNCVAQLTGSPEALKQEIPVAPSVVNLTGSPTAERIYAISQGNINGGALTWGTCDAPGSVNVTGEADAIETVSSTISARLPLGKCPVYGFMTPDTYRTFIMNRGSGTVTVINSQLNALDTTDPNLGPNATIPVGAGPVFADYYQTGQLLVTANYDSSTISIIDVSLDVYGNDSTTFGTVLKTIDLATGPGCPTGSDTYCMHPVELSVLQNGSRVYVANQGDIAAGISGSVSVVNLTNYTIEKTIPLPTNPPTNPHAIASIYNYPIGKVYVASQNSPYLTVIRTDTDVISDTPEMQGNIVDIHVSTQYPGLSTTTAANDVIESRSVGSGAP